MLAILFQNLTVSKYIRPTFADIKKNEKMKTEKFVLSALGNLPNGMLSAVKASVYSSASSAIKVMLVLFVCCMATGCQKNSPLPEEPLPSFAINEERMSVIADLSKDYEEAIKEAIAERVLLRSSGVTSAFDIKNRIIAIYQEKCNKYGSLSEISLRSGTDESQLDQDVLQEQLDKLGENWDVVIQGSYDADDSKEDFIEKIRIASSDFGASVLSDKSLNDFERQIVYENVVFRTNLAALTFQYDEEIRDLITTRGLFSWVKKSIKIIECTAKTVLAAANCATAAALTTTAVPAAIAAWATCVASTAAAAACWASL